MWSASTSRSIALALVAVGVTACGPRSLGITLNVDTTGCTLSIPAGGSLLYQVEANGSIVADGGGGSFCGACLAVTKPIASGSDLIAFLRANAPSCGGVQPRTTLGVRVSGWSSAGCPSSPGPGFCADAPTQLVPDGTSDGTLTFDLVCKPQCSGVCTPTTCAAQGKNCGQISDGCNRVLDCGVCHPPQQCGPFVANVCAKP